MDQLIYGSGSRLVGCLRLRVKNIDLEKTLTKPKDLVMQPFKKNVKLSIDFHRLILLNMSYHNYILGFLVGVILVIVPYGGQGLSLQI